MDFSKPHLIFALIWSGTFLLATSVTTAISTSFGPEVRLLVFGGIATFYTVALVVRIGFPLQPGTPRFPQFSDEDLTLLSAFIRMITGLWLAGWLLSILYSGGVPLWWLLVGDGRDYTAFGVPSFSGFLNMLRGFAVAGVVALHLQKRARTKDYAIAALLIFSALAEVTRGGMIVLALHGISMRILLRPISVRGMVQWGILLIGGLFFFDWLAQVRSGAYNTTASEVLGDTFGEGTLIAGLGWSFLYITSPLGNLAYASAQTLHPIMAPYYTLQPLLPGFIRDSVFAKGDYPIELMTDAWNATTFYSPLLADFGVIGALIAFTAMQFVICLCYRSAKQGILFGMLVYPPIFTAVTLSFFYSYFFALPIISYPIVIFWFLDFRRRRLARGASHASA